MSRLKTTIIGYRSPHTVPTPKVKELKGKYGRVLDIGCGNGRNFIFPVSVGLDADVKILNKTRRLGVCLCADGQNLPFRAGFFDLALFCYTLEFMKDQEGAWREAKRVAEKVFHLIAPSKNTWEKVHGCY